MPIEIQEFKTTSEKIYFLFQDARDSSSLEITSAGVLVDGTFATSATDAMAAVRRWEQAHNEAYPPAVNTEAVIALMAARIAALEGMASNYADLVHAVNSNRE